MNPASGINLRPSVGQSRHSMELQAAEGSALCVLNGKDALTFSNALQILRRQETFSVQSMIAALPVVVSNMGHGC